MYKNMFRSVYEYVSNCTRMYLQLYVYICIYVYTFCICIYEYMYECTYSYFRIQKCLNCNPLI